MPKITIAGKDYVARPLTAKQHAWYRGVLVESAKADDQPLARFLAKLSGVDGGDRKTAIAAFMARSDWDEPPAGLVRQAALTMNAVILLARLACTPEPPYEDCQSHATDPAAFYAALCEAMIDRPPTNEEIIERNKTLRERLAGTIEPEGESCPSKS